VTNLNTSFFLYFERKREILFDNFIYNFNSQTGWVAGRD